MNISRGKKKLDLLKGIRYTKELSAVVDYFNKSLAFDFWLNQTRFDFYESWDTNILMRKHEGFDPSVLCSESLKERDSAKINYIKYRLALYKWYNCLNHVFRKSLGEYPFKAWEQFLATYGNKEELIFDDSD